MITNCCSCGKQFNSHPKFQEPWCKPCSKKIAAAMREDPDLKGFVKPESEGEG